MGARAFKNPHHQLWICAEGDTLYGHFDLHAKGYFHVEKHGVFSDRVSLRTHHGRYIASTAMHQIYLAPCHSDETHWHLEHHDHGKVALRSHYGGYIGVDSNKLVLMYPMHDHPHCNFEEHIV